MADEKKVKKFQMTLNQDGYEKLKVVADKNQRSVVGQVAYWVYQNIEQYENEHGQISLLIQNNNNGSGKQINHNNINVPAGA